MKLSTTGKLFISAWENLRLTAYLDRPGGVWTIGYGHTGADVHAGQTCNQTQAMTWLVKDVQKAEAAVDSYVTEPLRQDQFDALVSFVFNCGVAAFRDSHLRIFVNQGSWAAAAAEFDRWVHDDGKILDGLVKRRAAERRLFETGEPSCPPPSSSPPPSPASLSSSISSGFSTLRSLFSRWRNTNPD